MKYIILFEVFDHDYATSWHSGSAISNFSSRPFDTEEEAMVYRDIVIEKNWNEPGHNGNERKCTVDTVIITCKEEDVELVHKIVRDIKHHYPPVIEE